MTGGAAVNARNGGSGNPGRMQYHRRVLLADGSLCLLQYNYTVPYADPELQEKLPDFQTSYLILLVLLPILYAMAVTRHYTRILKKDGGPDFSGEALAKAGTAFYREEGSRPGDRHLGLGLYFARRSALKHGGELTLKNTEAGGLAMLSVRMKINANGMDRWQNS